MHKKTILAGCLVALLAGCLAWPEAAGAQRRAGPGWRDNAPGRAPRQRLQQRLMQAIGLTPEQQQRMQEIRQQFDEDLAAAGRRVREARHELDEAIMSEPYDESLVEQRAEELIRAQAEQTRLYARMRARVRGVLTPEQVARFIELQRRVRRQWRERRRPERRPPGESDRLDRPGRSEN